MPIALDPAALEGQLVRLEPLAAAHVAGVAVAASGDRSTFRYTNVPDGLGAAEAYVADLLAARDQGEAVPFAQVRRADGSVLGCTRFMTLRHLRRRNVPDEVEIGGTWLAPSAHGTGVNTEAKLLLLGVAFTSWGVWRVDFMTDARNERSRAALAGIGATFEGVLRSHRLAADSAWRRPRDSAVYAITRDDWPGVSARLQERLQERLQQRLPQPANEPGEPDPTGPETSDR